MYTFQSLLYGAGSSETIKNPHESPIQQAYYDPYLYIPKL